VHTIWKALNHPVKILPVLILCGITVGKTVTPPPTMMASVANGDPLPDCFTIVDPPAVGGHTMVKIKLTLPCILHPTPAVSQHGTSTAVETAIANNKTQWPNDHDGAMHHDEPSSLLFPLDSLHHPKASYHIKTIMPSKVNLGAIKWMLCSNLGDHFLHLSPDKPSPMDNLVPLLDSSPLSTYIVKSHIDLDAIRQAIQRSLCEVFNHLYSNDATIADDRGDPTVNPTLLCSYDCKDQTQLTKRPLEWLLLIINNSLSSKQLVIS